MDSNLVHLHDNSDNRSRCSLWATILQLAKALSPIPARGIFRIAQCYRYFHDFQKSEFVDKGKKLESSYHRPAAEALLPDNATGGRRPAGNF